MWRPSKKPGPNLTFHLESEGDPWETIEAIHRAGMKAGISIKPGTLGGKAAALSAGAGTGAHHERRAGVRRAEVYAGESGKNRGGRRAAAPDIHISVDGGINGETGALCRKAGADVLVAGSYVFGAENPAAAIARLKGAEDGTQD